MLHPLLQCLVVLAAADDMLMMLCMLQIPLEVPDILGEVLYENLKRSGNILRGESEAADARNSPMTTRAKSKL